MTYYGNLDGKHVAVRVLNPYKPNVRSLAFYMQILRGNTALCSPDVRVKHAFRVSVANPKP